MKFSLTLTAIAIGVPTLAAGSFVSPATARTLHQIPDGVFGAVSATCLLDYANPNTTRMVVKNTSGSTYQAGSKVSWTAGHQRGSFYLQQSVAAGQTFAFGLNAKGYDCTVIVARLEQMESQ